jgi:transcription initiation factor TFIIIB Brf1 subunit/transcription initiation factor TFIIB
MAADSSCPQCNSVNVIFSKKRRLHVCEDCGHSFDISPLNLA